MKTNEHNATLKMKTLTEGVIESLETVYIENFKVIEKGLCTEDEKFIYIPQHVSIINFYRFEGYSDPQYNSILYFIETKDGLKGTLIDAYGVEADATISNFIRDVVDIHKEK